MTVTMKANRIHVFGGPEVILFEDVPRPTPVLIAGPPRSASRCSPIDYLCELVERKKQNCQRFASHAGDT
jgi:hypothetical protein